MSLNIFLILLVSQSHRELGTHDGFFLSVYLQRFRKAIFYYFFTFLKAL